MGYDDVIRGMLYGDRKDTNDDSEISDSAENNNDDVSEDV